MPLTAKLEVDLVVSTDDEQKNVLWGMSDKSLNQIVRDTLTVHSAGVASIAAAGSLTIPMGDVGTGAILHMRSDREVVVKLEAGAEEQVTIKPQGAYKGILVIHGEFTGVVATNKDGTNSAEVHYCIVGVE